MSAATYHIGDVFDVMATLPDDSVDLVLTSPPFLALRSYLPADHPDKAKEIGSEPTPAEFIDTLLALTAEWDRVLAPHGSICVELGDTYAGSGGGGGDYLPGGLREDQPGFGGSAERQREGNAAHWRAKNAQRDAWPLDKSLTGIPTLYAWSLAYGRNLLTGEPSPAGQWRIRNVVAWVRPNPPVGALGDKFRPGTSYITMACKARDRWFDLDDVRTALTDRALAELAAGGVTGGESYQGEAADGSGYSGARIRRPADGGGAPPLDWWQVSTEPYSGSHYATWPRKLLERPIRAMCPSEVCRTCGEPRRRIVERDAEPVEANLRSRGDRKRDGRGDESGVGNYGGFTTTTTTLGFTDCGHGSWCCRTCKVLVPYGDAVQRSREAQGSESQVGDEAVLGEPGQVTEQPSDDAGNLRAVRDRVHGAARSEMLHPELFGEVGPQGGSTELHPAEDADAGTEDSRAGRVHADLGSEGDAGPGCERPDDGAPGSDAGAPGSPARTVGDRPSPERDQGRQPDRESGSGDESEARRDGAVPALSGDVPGQLTEWSCRHCGGDDLEYVADHFRRGIVLDPFAGSGTTLAVATGLGRDAVGIDIDERNADLARERVGMFLTVAPLNGAAA